MKCIRCGKETNNSDNYCNECTASFSNDIFIEDDSFSKDVSEGSEPKLSLYKDESFGGESEISSDSIRYSNVEDNNVNDTKERNNSINYESNPTNANQSFNQRNFHPGNFKYCVACGQQMHASAKSCNNCGTEAGPLDDNGNLGLAVAGCCIPIIGFILYFVWRDTRVKSAKQCLTGAIIGAVAIPVLYLLFIFITTVLLLGGAGF